MNQSYILRLIPILLSFFAMGAVDLAGTAGNYLKQDFALSDTIASAFTSMVFLWFLIFSIPTGILMNKIGRRKTVILSLYITLAALVLPFMAYNLPIMIVSLSLLGIGNAALQVSLNPLLTNITPPKRLPSILTLGQFIKASAAFGAPMAVAACVAYFGSWIALMGFFAIECLIALLWLSKTPIPEQKQNQASSLKTCFALLKELPILLCFIGIMCHVGIDVGTNASAPRIIGEKLNIPLNEAVFATSIYFMFRTLGSLFGVALLAKFRGRIIFTFSVILMAIAMTGLILVPTKPLIYTCLAFIGLGNANIFSVIFAQAMLLKPDKKNEISGLMITGIVGGALFPLIMGSATDILGDQMGAMVIMLGCMAFLLIFSRRLKI